MKLVKIDADITVKQTEEFQQWLQENLDRPAVSYSLISSHEFMKVVVTDKETGKRCLEDEERVMEELKKRMDHWAKTRQRVATYYAR